MSFAEDYNDVASRIRQFRDKHPEGSLQPADLTKPYTVERLGDETFIVYCAAAFRSPTDPRPGVGIAWEPVPGKTNFTRGSEIQNAETSAWGRAIVAVLAADTKRVASNEEIQSAHRARTPNEPKNDADPERVAMLVADVAEFANPDFQAWVDEFKVPWSEKDCQQIEASLAPWKEAALA